MTTIIIKYKSGKIQRYGFTSDNLALDYYKGLLRETNIDTVSMVWKAQP